MPAGICDSEYTAEGGIGGPTSVQGRKGADMAIQQGTVTITGFVGSMPVPFGRSGGVEGCSFRMGSTRRYRDGGTGEWHNLPTTWIP